MSGRVQSAGLVMAGFAGTEPDDQILDLVRDGLAGVILFSRNIASVDQIVALTAALQEQAATHGHPRLLIAVDHEGGRVQRIRLPGVTGQPAAMALGSAGDTLLTYRAASLAAHELRSLGVNLNLAPCADVNAWPRNAAISTRSFGSDPGAVAGHVDAYVRGAQDSGLLTTAKHFPGHGATTSDSHFDLPTVTRDPRDLRSVDLVPFRAAIAAGVAAIMPGHLVVPGLTAGLPATLSSAALDGLLREELGFSGLILSDCLEMAAISARYQPGDASMRAVLAGVDLLLWSHTMERQVAAREALAAAAADGGAAARRLAAAHRRVLALREALDSHQPVVPDQRGPAEGARFTASVYRRALRILRDETGLLPLAVHRAVTVVGLARTPQSEPAATVHARLAAILGAHGCVTKSIPAVVAGGLGSAIDEACAAVASAAEVGGVSLLLSRDAAFDEEQLAAARRIAGQAPSKTIVVALGLPDDAWYVAAPSSAAVTYDEAEGALAALAEVLCGKARPAAFDGH